MKGEYCHVKAMIRRYVHLQDNGAKPDDIISGYYDHCGEGHATDEDMYVAVRRAVLVLGLAKHGLKNRNPFATSGGGRWHLNS